jgi:steroid delta-isomerase-like uncharacterized protein
VSSETQKNLVRRYYEEMWNPGNLTLIDELFAPSYANYDPATPGGVAHGPEGMKQLVSTYKSAFPDLHFTIEEMFAEGDRVATRWIARATHQGEMNGIPATGKPAAVTGITITHFANGQIVEDRVNWDTLGLLQQLGVVPTPGQVAV